MSAAGRTEEPSSTNTVLFTDMVGSTARAVELGDRAWAELLAQHHRLVRHQVRRHGGWEQDAIGDGFFVVFRAPDPALACALAIVADLDAAGITIRSGLHAGDCLVVDEKCTGLAIHIGARLAALALPGEILVSAAVRRLADPSFAFVERGTHELRDVPGRWDLFALAG